MSEIKVHIEYCGGWGYEPSAFALRDAILAGVPGSKVKCDVGRSQSFEVKVNETIIFSKFETKGKVFARFLIKFLEYYFEII